MNTCLQTSNALTFEQSNDSLWITLYTLLLPQAKRWVYASNTFSWIGQENDLAWDIVLVTIQRTYEYMLKAQGENIPIGSFQRLSIKIARNYFQDLRRKDSRLQHFNRDSSSQVENTIRDEINTAEVVLNKVYQEWLFQEIAKTVANFSPKLRRAMLIEISRHTDFDTKPNPLKAAFLKQGIELEEYVELLPQEPILRSRHFSLVSFGRKKLRTLFRNWESCDFATAAQGA